MATFDFGSGPVPAHQHPNGGGWVADTARVADSCYVGPDARVFEFARVNFGSELFDQAAAYGTCLLAQVVMSSSSSVSGSAVVDRTELQDKAHIFDHTNVEKALIRETVQIGGTSRIKGVGLAGNYRILGKQITPSFGHRRCGLKRVWEVFTSNDDVEQRIHKLFQLLSSEQRAEYLKNCDGIAGHMMTKLEYLDVYAPVKLILLGRYFK